MKNKLQKIADFFDLGEVIEIEKAAGNANDNSYIVTDQGKFLVKIIEERDNPEEVVTEVDFIDRLDGNLKIVPYIKNDDGVAMYHQDEVVALVQPYLKNTSVDFNEKAILQLVGEQSRMHLVDASGLPDRKHWIDLGYIGRALDEIEEKGWMINTDSLRNHSSVSQDWSDCPKGIVHGDLHLGNALFNENEELLVIIDWEEVGLGHYVLDLAITLSAFCFENEGFNEVLFKKIVTTYEEVRELAQVEKDLLYTAVNRAFITAFVWKCLRKHAQGEDKVWDANDCNCFKYF